MTRKKIFHFRKVFLLFFKIQKKIIRRLDELIKKLENQANQQQKKGGGGGKGGKGGIPNAGSCPDGSGSGSGSGGGEAGSPMQDSNPGGGSGEGNVDQKKNKKLAEKWGNLPERERARALQELTQGLGQAHREAIENYFRNLARRSARRY